MTGINVTRVRIAVVALLHAALFAAGALGMRVEVDAASHETTVLTVGHDIVLPPEIAAARVELRRILGLDPEATEFRLVFGSVALDTRQISVGTRSLIQLMQIMASQVDVPSADVVDGRVPRGWADTPGMPAATRLIEISSGEDAPDDAAVAIHYRKH